MRRVIANSLDDFTALAVVLQGVYRPSATAATTAALGGLAYSLALPAVIAYVLLSQDSHTNSLEAALLLALAVSGPAIGYLTFVRRASTFLVEEGSLACNVPLGLGSWSFPLPNREH